MYRTACIIRPVLYCPTTKADQEKEERKDEGTLAFYEKRQCERWTIEQVKEGRTDGTSKNTWVKESLLYCSHKYQGHL